MPAHSHFACLLLGLVWASSAAESPSLSQVLAEHGHPDIRACSVASRKGVGQLLTIQFRTSRDAAADRRRAVDILTLLTPSMPDSVRWFGFEPSRRLKTCRERDPDLVFWHDHERNWRLVSDAPVDFLTSFLDGLSEHQRNTPAEAYVLFSLGIVQQRLRRFEDSLIALERADTILEAAGTDPYDIRPYILVPLVHHAADVGDEEAVDRHLTALAPIIGNVDSHDGDYLPLVKKAPVYPIRAMQRGITGYVLLEFTVDRKGRVRNPVILEEAPPAAGFGPAALEAAAAFRYIPQVVDGEFVSVNGVRNLVTFELQ